jgi:hypothetical protein
VLIGRTDRNCAAGKTPGSTDGENAVAAPANAARNNDRDSIGACKTENVLRNAVRETEDQEWEALCVPRCFFVVLILF